MIMFYVKFVLIINKNHKISSNDLVSILKVFWQFTTNNALKAIIRISRIKTYYYTFFKIFLISLA